MISGAGPKYRPEIDGGHKGLEQHLAERGFKYEQTYGQHEPSFIVHNIPRDQAMELGRKAGQEHILHSNLGQNEFVYVNGPQAGKYHPGSGFEHFHRVPTDSGPRLLIPTAGFVRFGIDKSKLLDVPKKGQDMSMNHEKSEVTVADFKKALSKTLQNQIDKYSRSLVELAKTEVANSDEQPAVGELKLIKSDFIIEIPDTICPTCFQNDTPESCTCLTATGLTKSAFGLTVAAAMQRVYESYKTNVSGPMFPNEPEKAHALAMQVATDWATRSKAPDAAARMALGHAPGDYAASAHDTTPSEVKNPDSMSPPPLAAPAAPAASLEPQYEPRAARENWGKSELDKSLKTKIAAVGAAAALAGGAIAGGSASTPSDKQISAHTKQFTQDKQNQPPVNPHEKYRKTEGESAMCKTCKSEMCKCMEKGDVKLKDPQAGRRALTADNFKNRRVIDDKKDDEKRAELSIKGYDATVKNMDWKSELDKSDAWMQKSAPPGFGEDTMLKLEAKYGTNLGKSVAWAAYKKKNHGKVKKGELFVDAKNEGAPPTSTDQAKTGAPRVKNVGFENDKPAPPSKDVPGKLDEGSGGKVTKGKGLNKFDLAPGAPVASDMAASEKSDLRPSKEHLEREKEHAARPPHIRVDATGADVARAFKEKKDGLAKAGPPMAKPPGGGTGLTPKMPGQSKPGSAKAISTTPKLPKPPKMGAAPKMAGALGKADVTGMARIAQAGKQPIQSMSGATPKLTPAQMGPGTSGLSLAPPKPQVQGASALNPGRTSQIGAAFTPGKLMGKSEQQFQDLQKSLGSCLNCGKTEHPGVCNAT